LPLLVSTLLN